MWDAREYLQFADERARPFVELLARVQHPAAAHVVDLGCGPGNLTALLVDRFAHAQVVGVDNDDAMLVQAATQARARLTFECCDVLTWRARAPVDVLVTTAMLQWVPHHLELLPQLTAQLAPGGWFALQVPSNFDDPHQVCIRALRAQPQWSALLSTLPARPAHAHSALQYADALATLGFVVDAWETTYLHVMHGDDPVLAWVRGTALRPIFALLDDDACARFCAELAPLLRDAYPARSWGTPFQFKRAFVVAHRANAHA